MENMSGKCSGVSSSIVSRELFGFKNLISNSSSWWGLSQWHLQSFQLWILHHWKQHLNMILIQSLNPIVFLFSFRFYSLNHFRFLTTFQWFACFLHWVFKMKWQDLYSLSPIASHLPWGFSQIHLFFHL